MQSGVRATPAPPPMSSRARAIEVERRPSRALIVVALVAGALVLVAATAAITIYWVR
jgi:hypothetical protein